jgi:hypothetical protein
MSVDLAYYKVTKTAHPVWGKLPALLDAMRKYPEADWIWWLDIDAIIMSPEIDLHKYLLDPETLQSKFLNGEPIIYLTEELQPTLSGLMTKVQR